MSATSSHLAEPMVIQAVLEYARDVIVVLDDSLMIVEASRSAEKSLGRPLASLVGTRVLDLVTPDEREGLHETLNTLVEAGVSTSFECKLIRADGTLLPLQWSVTWVAPVGRVIAAGRDLSERLEIERRLRSAQRMEAVGRLTGRIAHDFNNILAIILGNAELLVEHLADDEAGRSQAELISQAADRGATMISRLLAYSQRQHLDSHRIEPAAFLQGLVPRLSRLLRKDVSLATHIVGAPWPVQIDIGQLETSLEDLVVNAIDAMPRGGTVCIHCDNYSTGFERVSRKSLGVAGSRQDIEPGDYVRIVVEDEGEGMTAEVLASAFEPFFTTKEVGKGTGLGLSMVLGFIRQSEGHIGISSSPGHGTRVTPLLPRAAEPASAAPWVRGEVGASTPAEDVAHILVVDDEAAMLKHVVALLNKSGFQAVGAIDARQALELLAGPQRFDLLFTDVLMPGGMNGRQLVEEARKHRPGLKVLYTSGYTAEVLAGRHEGEIEADMLLTKPYRKNDLLERVRLALG